MRRTLEAATVVAALMATLPASCSNEQATVRRGRLLAERDCSTCHAVGTTGESPYQPAPPLRTLHEHYPVDYLAEAFAEGISVGHAGTRPMPEFVLSPDEIDDLLAYLQSLEG